jgi:uncharacterized membrane protein SirB2
MFVWMTKKSLGMILPVVVGFLHMSNERLSHNVHSLNVPVLCNVFGLMMAQ